MKKILTVMKVEVERIFPLILKAAETFHDVNRISHTYLKGFGNYVTDADKTVQETIRLGLSQLYPDIQFLAEEKDNNDIDISGDFWILDPIDGTLNLIHDFAHSAISLGYAEAGELVLGVMYDPYRDEMFYAERGQGAFMIPGASSGKREKIQIHVSGHNSLTESVVIFGTAPYNRAELGSRYRDSVYEVFQRCQDIRRFGAAVLDFAWVACGRAEAYFEHVYPWDRAAGSIIVQEAGGKVCSFDGSAVPITGFHDVIAGVPEVVDEIVRVTEKFFYQKL